MRHKKACEHYLQHDAEQIRIQGGEYSNGIDSRMIQWPWLDNVIARNDIIYLATEPIDSILFRINKLTGERELTGFGREYQYLIDHGYHYDEITKMMKK